MEQLTIATLTEMPRDTCTYMKDWLLLHFYPQQPNLMEQHIAQANAKKLVKSSELKSLRQEVKLLRQRRDQAQRMKTAFQSTFDSLRQLSE